MGMENIPCGEIAAYLPSVRFNHGLYPLLVRHGTDDGDCQGVRFDLRRVLGWVCHPLGCIYQAAPEDVPSSQLESIRGQDTEKDTGHGLATRRHHTFRHVVSLQRPRRRDAPGRRRLRLLFI